MADVLRSVLFLNIIILDATEGVKEKIKDKIDKTNMPKGMREAAKKIGAKAATKMATPSTIATKMSQEMPKKMPIEMKAKGIVVEAETVFLEGPYLVVQLQVQKLDTVAMAEMKALEAEKERNEKEDKLRNIVAESGGGKTNYYFNKLKQVLMGWLIGLVISFLKYLGGQNNLRSLEEYYLPQVVQTKMEPVMNEMLKVKFSEEMKMDAETMVLSDNEQAKYFYQKLRQVRKQAKEKSKSSLVS